MATTIEREMMTQCCDAEGKLDFGKIKTFMESCGKKEFKKEEIEKMKELCRGHGEFCNQMMQFMSSCGCSCK